MEVGTTWLHWLFSGGRRFNFMRRCCLWKHYRDYFPVKGSSPRPSPSSGARSWVRVGVVNDALWSRVLPNLQGRT